jgi:hypothetical protein
MRLLATLFLLSALLGDDSVGDVPKKLRRSLNLDEFYVKALDVRGMPIVSSGAVSNEAFHAARDVIERMLSGRPEAYKRLRRNKGRLAIIGRAENTTDIPEHAHLNEEFERTGQGTDWNKRARGLGGTTWIPVCSVGEENLLGLEGDRYRGESILIHEFAHTLANLAFSELDSKFERKLAEAYEEAVQAGLWAGTYAATNPQEYWAEGVQSWFDANLEVDPPNGIHNEIDTRAELKEYDPELAELIAEWFPDDEWRYSYPGTDR